MKQLENKVFLEKIEKFFWKNFSYVGVVIILIIFSALVLINNDGVRIFLLFVIFFWLIFMAFWNLEDRYIYLKNWTRGPFIRVVEGEIVEAGDAILKRKPGKVYDMGSNYFRLLSNLKVGERIYFFNFTITMKSEDEKGKRIADVNIEIWITRNEKSFDFQRFYDVLLKNDYENIREPIEIHILGIKQNREEQLNQMFDKYLSGEINEFNLIGKVRDVFANIRKIIVDFFPENFSEVEVIFSLGNVRTIA